MPPHQSPIHNYNPHSSMLQATKPSPQSVKSHISSKIHDSQTTSKIPRGSRRIPKILDRVCSSYARNRDGRARVTAAVIQHREICFPRQRRFATGAYDPRDASPFSPDKTRSGTRAFTAATDLHIPEEKSRPTRSRGRRRRRRLDCPP